MNGLRLSYLLDKLAWSQQNLARRLQLSAHTPVKRWCDDTSPTPSNVAEWMEFVAAPVILRPLPNDWKAILPDGELQIAMFEVDRLMTAAASDRAYYGATLFKTFHALKAARARLAELQAKAKAK